jgi:hypothetical protein
MLWAKQPAPGVGDAVRAATDVGEATTAPSSRSAQATLGTVWATPLEQGVSLKLSPCQKESTAFLSVGTLCSVNALRSSEDLLDPLGAVSPFGLPSHEGKAVMRPCHEKVKLDDCTLLWTLFCLSGRAAAQFLQKRRWVGTSQDLSYTPPVWGS